MGLLVYFQKLSRPTQLQNWICCLGCITLLCRPPCPLKTFMSSLPSMRRGWQTSSLSRLQGELSISGLYLGATGFLLLLLLFILASKVTKSFAVVYVFLYQYRPYSVLKIFCLNTKMENKLGNYTAVARTARATPGLSNMFKLFCVLFPLFFFFFIPPFLSFFVQSQPKLCCTSNLCHKLYVCSFTYLWRTDYCIIGKYG